MRPKVRLPGYRITRIFHIVGHMERAHLRLSLTELTYFWFSPRLTSIGIKCFNCAAPQTFQISYGSESLDQMMTVKSHIASVHRFRGAFFTM